MTFLQEYALMMAAAYSTDTNQTPTQADATIIYTQKKDSFHLYTLSFT